MRGLRLRLEDLYFLSWRARLMIAIPVLAVIAASLWIAVQFLHPLPPRRVVLATGPEGGALHAIGLQYASQLRRAGITVDVRATQGVGENLHLLASCSGSSRSPSRSSRWRCRC